jgi:hypothetical protein
MLLKLGYSLLRRIFVRVWNNVMIVGLRGIRRMTSLDQETLFLRGR